MRPGEIVSRGTNDTNWVRALVGFGSLQVFNVVMALILQISSGILAEAGLSILGLGPRTTEVPTLGLMMNWARIYQADIQGRWWAYMPVLVTIAMVTFSMNLMNTGLDQVFNPALRD